MRSHVFRRAFLAALLTLLLLSGLAFIGYRSAEDGLRPPPAREDEPPGQTFPLPPQAAFLLPRPIRLLAQGAALALESLRNRKAPPEYENAKRVSAPLDRAPAPMLC